MKHFVQGVVNRFSSTTPNRVRGILRKNLVDAIEAPLEDVFEFKIFYLDRLIRPPLKWGVLPRTKVWTLGEINKAKKADRYMNGDFGKLGICTVNVAYGRPHEQSALDVMPVKRRVVASKVVEALLNFVKLEEEDVEKELIFTQGAKKRVKDGHDYFGWE
uniref:Uncharacterized protein n=1 Tax=Chenopodium quinoa TaxID=63459 RepID=A0A803M0W8_CHEQI